MASLSRQTTLEANHYTVRRLLEYAQAGIFRIPPFQRALRWQSEDHALFLDSLYRGYPVGTLLLWKREAPQERLTFGKLSIDAPKMSDALWIVDGQQRLTSLVACLLHPEGPTRRRADVFAFDFNLDLEKFSPSGQKTGPEIIPVGTLFDSVALSEWADAHKFSADRRRKAEQARDALRDYEIPVYITKTDSDLELRSIFERANNAGKRMRSEEIFDALNTATSQAHTTDGSDLKILNQLKTFCIGLQFGIVAERTLQKALICVANHDPKKEIPTDLRQPDAARPWLLPTQKALEKVIAFLQEECAIPYALLLPYDLPIIILARFFHRFADPSERNLELLTRWVWRGIATNTHETSNSRLSPHYQALQLSDEDSVVQALLTLVPRRRPAEFPVSKVFSLGRNMRTRLELSALFRLQPRHIGTQKLVSPLEIFEPIQSEVAPDQLPLLNQDQVSPLQKPPVSVKASSNYLAILPVEGAQKQQVAAHFLHPPVHGGAQRFALALKQAPEAVLTSHGIPLSSVNAVRGGDWPAVIAARREEIARQVASTIDHFARWNEDDDGPSLSSILGGDYEHQESGDQG